MNLHEYILAGGLADADPGEIAASYIKSVLALGNVDEQVTALEPSVRSHAARLASAVRRSQRSHGPAQSNDDSKDRHGAARENAKFMESAGGPAQGSSATNPPRGGPAQDRDDSQVTDGGPAWAQQDKALIKWCREHAHDNYWIPGAGRRKLAEITAPQWEARARQLAEQAKGTARTAGRMREFAALITAAGTSTIGEILSAVEA